MSAAPSRATDGTWVDINTRGCRGKSLRIASRRIEKPETREPWRYRDQGINEEDKISEAYYEFITEEICEG